MDRLTHMIVLFAVLLLLSSNARSEDWPMWRGDAYRSAALDNSVPDSLHLQWRKHFGPRTQAWDDPLNLDLMTYDRSLEPIVYQNRVYLGFNDQDKVLALDAESGEQCWVFYTEAPVRLPPVAWDGKLYFCSDDSYLYCVDATTGQLIWKFRGAPNAQHAIGNERLVSAWPARGGPVLYDGTVYFAASIWPFMGTFLYALDADTGSLQWLNDSTGAQYIRQPHSAPSFAGVAPQGALVATEKWLIVPGGRSVPAVFDRKTGDLEYFEINAGGKGTGGSFVTADDTYFYVHTRRNGTRAFELSSGKKTAFMPNNPVLHRGRLFSSENTEGLPLLRAYDMRDATSKKREPIWEVEGIAADDLIVSGDTLVAAYGQSISLIQIPSSKNQLRQPRVRKIRRVEELEEGERIARVLAASQRLFVVGSSGTLCALGGPVDISEVAGHVDSNHGSSSVETESLRVDEQFTDDLRRLGDAEGYALWFGNADSALLWQIISNTPFVQLAVIDSDAERVHKLRERLDRLGMIGKVTAHVGTPHDFRAPPYVANMVFASITMAASDRELRAMYKSVRPYGGVLALLDEEGNGWAKADMESLSQLNLEQADVRISTWRGSETMLVRRMGALPGSADWTHQYGNVANTVKSDDRRVKLPLGILWFGGSSNMDVLPRHGHGPPEQVVGGRLFIEGMNSLSARDVYTGRVLWKREFENLGTFDIYYDATYENTPLNPKYNQVHIPGANGRGTNYVVTEDRIYLVVGDRCLMLDPATGEDAGSISLPANPDGSRPEWGYIGIYENILLGGVGFANYRDQHDLEFDSEKKLKGNQAGFGVKSLDKAASRSIVAFDRLSGKPLWRLDATHSFWHNGIVAGAGLVYCLDKNPKKVEEAMRRRGLSLPDSYRIIAVDAKTGQEAWEVNEGIFGTWLGYSTKHDLLLQAGAQASDRLTAEVGQGMRVYRAKSGELHWKKDNLKYAGPCILHNDLIITNANSYAESAGAFYLDSGKQRMIKHPLTGQQIPWKMTRAYGCNNIIASENLLTFRSGAAGYYDLTNDAGTGNLGGFKSGCTSNLVVANGVLNAPDYTRTCSCSYQNQTSLGLVHMPDVEVWSVNALAPTLPELPRKEIEQLAVESVGINFAAAGDRYDDEGQLWLEYPVKAGDSPPFELTLNPEVREFTEHSIHRESTANGWIAASGLENILEATLVLRLQEEVDLAKGISVAHRDDDAEESNDGTVSTGSSDLELVDDGGDQQTVGLRFESVPLTKDSVIHAAYLQFTCDETSEEPTNLTITAERSVHAARFSNDSHDITSRNRTTTEVAWSPPAWEKAGAAKPAQRSPNIQELVQEIIAQDGWESGNPMAFLIQGEGKRVASARNGKGKGSAKLIVIVEESETEEEAIEPTNPYAVELLFAAPRSTSDERVFDVYLQDQLVGQDVHVNAGSDNPGLSQLLVPNVPIGREVRLRFVPKQGMPLLNGMRLQRQPR